MEATYLDFIKGTITTDSSSLSGTNVGQNSLNRATIGTHSVRIQPISPLGSALNISSGRSRCPYASAPNSVYEQIKSDGKVGSRAFYDENGRQYKRQDFDHEHFDKKTRKFLNPHEHLYRYNPMGQQIGKDVREITDGSTNNPSV